MANESVIDNQVDLNNNSNGDKLGKRESNGESNGECSSKNEIKQETNSTSDDLVYKLKQIILQQEKEENDKKLKEKLNKEEQINQLNRSTVQNNSSPELDKKSGKKSPICQINKSPTPSRKMINQSNNENKIKIDQESNEETNEKINKKTNQETNGETNKEMNKEMNGEINKEINKKMSKELMKDLNEKLTKDLNEPLIKETIQKINEKAIKKINETSLTKLSNGHLSNGHSSNIKILVNGKCNSLTDSIDSSSISCSISESSMNDDSISGHSVGNEDANESINYVKNMVNQTNELDKKEIIKLNKETVNESIKKSDNESINEGKQLVNGTLNGSETKKMNSKLDNSNKDQTDGSIKIIQSKSISNKNSNKSTIQIDSNNNLAEKQHKLNDSIEQEATNDKQVKLDKQKESVKELNGDNSLVKQVNKEEMPEIELIIRASNIDGKRKGADLFCQEYFMDLYLLAELNYIHLKISTVDLNKLSPSFRAKFDCTKPPILLVKTGNEQRAVLENEKIERYIMKNIPGGHLLFVKDPETAKLIENLYSKFKLALSRNEPHTKQSLLRHLEAIDKHLGERKTKFITGDDLCCFDFELITKLQHLRIAGEYFIDQFEIPKNLINLWNYMNTMYHLNAFIEASPDDQTIISHYLNSNLNLANRSSPAKSKNKTHLELQKPSITMSTP